MAIRAVMTLGVLAVAYASPVLAQTSLGTWETPFDHDIKSTWYEGQSLWDGETASEHRPVVTDANGNTIPYARFMAGHMSLIPCGDEQGKVLVWNYMHFPSMPTPLQFKQHWAIVDVNGTTSLTRFQNFDLDLPTYMLGPDTFASGDLFCSGHAWTEDGDLLVAGGNRHVGSSVKGSKVVYRFLPGASLGNAMWQQELDMEAERWYPTVTATGEMSAISGKELLIVTGGYRDISNGSPPTNLGANSYEVFDPSYDSTTNKGAWVVNPANSSTQLFVGPTSGTSCTAEMLWIYPRVFLLSGGSLFVAGMSERSYRLHLDNALANTTPVWDSQPSNSPPINREYASAFLYPDILGIVSGGGWDDKVVRLGGRMKEWITSNGACTRIDPGSPAAPVYTDSVAWISAASSNLSTTTWSSLPSLQEERYHQNTVLLPDGTVFMFGGNTDPDELDCNTPVLTTEIFNAVSNDWIDGANATIRRGYHSAGVLLPDGRVLTGGGEERTKDYEVYNPPYMTNGTERPVITTSFTPGQGIPMTYSTQYYLEYQTPTDPNVIIRKVVFMAPGSVTHHTDMHQRYVELAASAQTGFNNRAYFTLPATASELPRGYYMVILVSNVQSGASRGTPSEAVWALVN